MWRYQPEGFRSCLPVYALTREENYLEDSWKAPCTTSFFLAYGVHLNLQDSSSGCRQNDSSMLQPTRLHTSLKCRGHYVPASASRLPLETAYSYPANVVCKRLLPDRTLKPQECLSCNTWCSTFSWPSLVRGS